MMNQPMFEGRPLVNPDEEVVDQGLQFDITTLMQRRGMLALLGASLGAVSLAACSAEISSGTSATPSASGTGSLTEIPDETAGPYPGNGSNGADVLEQSGVVRSDIRSSFGDSTTTAEGVPMTLELEIIDMAGGNIPFEGVAVYVWHCDREGGYSMYSDGITGENYLRGVQIADSDGRVQFTSIFPACYSGRWPHIHFEVYPDEASIVDAENAISTSQIALPAEVCDAVYELDDYPDSLANMSAVSLDSDNVFGDDGGVHQLATVTGSVSEGYHVYLEVPVDTNTEPTGGSVPGGGASGSGGGGRPPSR